MPFDAVELFFTMTSPMYAIDKLNHFLSHLNTQACGDAKSKPAFLSDKTLESSIKYIVRRFPNIDTKGVSEELQIHVDMHYV